jgi:ferrous iron transport protein B
MGVSLGAAFVAREVAVSTLATIYSIEAPDKDIQQQSLGEALKHDPHWTFATALGYLAFFVFAMQCMSTLAVVYKETNTWRWPLFMFVYLTGSAFLVAYLVQVMARWGVIAGGTIG